MARSSSIASPRTAFHGRSEGISRDVRPRDILSVVRMGGPLALRLTAVVVLVLGIVVMHHTARADHEASAAHRSSAVTTAEHDVVPQRSGVIAAPAGADRTGMRDDAPSTAHDLLHLCLAVLTAALVLVAGLLLLIRHGMPMLLRLRYAVFGRPRTRAPPRPHGVSLLMFVCVIRT